MRFHVKEHAISLTDSFTVRDDADNILFEVRGKLFHIGDHFTIYDSNGQEVMQMKQVLFAHTRQYEMSRNGVEIATLRKEDEPYPYNAHFEITSRDGMAFYVQGNLEEWDLHIIDHYGRLLGNINREFSILGDKYTVDTVPEADGAFMVAIAVLLDEIKEDRQI